MLKKMEMLKVKDGILMKVHVKPQSKSFKIKADNTLIVFCTQSPAKGKANRELIRGLSKIFGKEVEIVSGYQSKRKRILVKDIMEKEMREILTVTQE